MYRNFKLKWSKFTSGRSRRAYGQMRSSAKAAGRGPQSIAKAVWQERRSRGAWLGQSKMKARLGMDRTMEKAMESKGGLNLA